jgi:hypothetical protein
MACAAGFSSTGAATEGSRSGCSGKRGGSWFTSGAWLMGRQCSARGPAVIAWTILNRLRLGAARRTPTCVGNSFSTASALAARN